MRTCTIDGCERKHAARGYCHHHYRKQFGRGEKPMNVECVVCGTVVQRNPSGKYRNQLPTCGYQCWRDLTYGISEPLPPDHWARWYGATSPWSPPKPRRARFVVAACDECGQHFATDRRVGGWRPTDRVCSRRCRRRVGKRRRKAREHGLNETFKFIDVIKLWMQFDKRCAYCEEPTDGLPDPDHVVPLSRGGRNTLANILPACRLCNSHKNDLTLTEWQADRQERGLPPRRYAWDADDPRFRHLVLTEATGKPNRAAA